MTESDTIMNSENLRKEIVEGLIYTHARLRENTHSSLESSSFLYALIELLNQKGLISIEELDERKLEVAERLAKRNRDKGVGVLLQEPEYDKYTFEKEADIDCENRIHLCKAACCRLPFALSKQDIREGIVHWDLGQPYIISQSNDGFCEHLESQKCECTIRENRPVPCRAYDCSKDKVIWLDFEKKVINPDILEDNWPHSVKVSNPNQ